ncbi:LLM class flavin-dependent oxidoreductase [Nakamurella sp. YIM 132087]|uniref:LLM class flavin-dependent oxidoreductase n=1 Tax=Nakamurella alba TaxID=2665158 RepID=A0A7K1FH43_9ACTN|nr:LLM class flavin-dependent oxidoreductase [Nakamurella alba]MTD13441.1 LLM class flavin-dependent oxidoreductase [Nakamurella alba]
MRFGIVLPIQSAGTPLDEHLEQLRAEVRAADAAGFDAFFLPEFHSTRAGGVVSPLLVGANLVAGTRRIRVGQAVVAGPLHHPVRLAEDALMLGHLTRGRALLGIGSAHVPADFRLYGVDRPARFRMTREYLEVIRACWSGEPFDIDGEFGHWAGQVTPLPYDGIPPELWMGAHGEKGMRLAAEQADVWVADPQRHIDVVARLAARFREQAATLGRTPRVAAFRDGWIANSRAECEQHWLPGAMAVHRLYYNVGVYHREFEPWVDDVADRANFTPDVLAPGRFLFGTGEDLRAELTDWHERAGLDYVAIRMRQPGGPGHAETLDAIAMMGEQVIGPLADLGAPAPVTHAGATR